MPEIQATSGLLPDLQALLPVIIVADDEVMVRNLVAAILRREDYTVLTCANGAEALELSRQYSGTIDLLLTDERMPHLGGIDLAISLRAERPGIKVLVMGGADLEDIERENLDLPFLPKPFNGHKLMARVREILGL